MRYVHYMVRTHMLVRRNSNYISNMNGANIQQYNLPEYLTASTCMSVFVCYSALPLKILNGSSYSKTLDTDLGLYV